MFNMKRLTKQAVIMNTKTSQIKGGAGRGNVKLYESFPNVRNASRAF